MSRLTDLIAQAKAKDAALGQELEREFKVLSSRRSFGLNFERHRPERVELSGRPVRKGDKVHILPPRGSTAKGDQRLWKVRALERANGNRLARLDLLGENEGERQAVAVDDLVVVAEVADYIYPGLVRTGRVERGGDKPFHTVINGENFHALEALTFTHRGKIDVVYIDPPYNSGAKDWKYNNDYIESDDLYRHSKWLAFIERRLVVSKELLNPHKSALIVSIDEKEYLRLGLLLEQVFPEGRIQMVSSIINPAGAGRRADFSRTDEYIFFVQFGASALLAEDRMIEEVSVVWDTLRRSSLAGARGRKGRGACGPNQFFPIFVNQKTGRIVEIGEPLAETVAVADAPTRPGCVTVLPIRPDGTEMNWGITPDVAKRRLADGHLRAGKYAPNAPQPYVISYLTGGIVRDIALGKVVVKGIRSDATVDAYYPTGKEKMPTTNWNRPSHDAQRYGTEVLKALIGSRAFPYPKSLYAVEDCLKILVSNNPNAIVLDFFAGSGTTQHAVMRLNHQDQGRRQCISVTNNEASASEQLVLRKSGFRPGDEQWEEKGICDYITKPRITAAITGQKPDGTDIGDDYKFIDEFPMAEGFEENADFFTLTYETPVAVSHNRAFERIAPLLWMRAGSDGRQIDTLPSDGWDVADSYGLLVDLDKAAPFSKALAFNRNIRVVYIVTDDDRRFQAVVRQLSGLVEPIRLYESYLTNFRFSMGR